MGFVTIVLISVKRTAGIAVVHCVGIALALWGVHAGGQQSPPTSTGTQSSPALPSSGQLPPPAVGDIRELVRKAVQNEINSSGAHFQFQGTKTTPKGSTTKLYVETSEATAGLAIAYNGKPLTADQQRDEQARLDHLAQNPEELRKKKAQERGDTERTMRILRAIPDAFLFEYEGQEMASPGIGHPGDALVKLKFRPNPSYAPPSRVEEVLTAMQGDVLVDAARDRLASIDGMLFKEVGFGWGILGHLDRGGHFLVHQAAVDDNLWEISRMTLKFEGRILLIKSLSIESTEEFSGFKRVPTDLTFAQAVDLLKKEWAAGSVETPVASDLGR